MSPTYEYECIRHGVFEGFASFDNYNAPSPCPRCLILSDRIISVPTVKIIQGKKQLPFGTGSPGRMITHKETGGMGVYIPSYGSMEQDEVDYIAEGAIEKEKARVKKKKKSIQRESQALVQAYVDLANKTPRGQKAKVLRQAIKDTARV